MLTYADICARLEREEPAIWRECYPRIYQHVERYGAPKTAAAMAAVAVTWARADYRGTPPTTRNIYLGACVQRQYQFPALFLAPGMFAAIAETEPPADLRWQDLPLPFEAGTLCLPAGALRHPDGGACDVLCWARVRAGEALEWPGAPAVKLEEDVFIAWAGLTGSPGFPLLDSVLNARSSPLVGDSHSPGVHTQPGRDGIYSLPLAASESEFLRQCRAIVFSALLAIEARPALLSEGRRVRAQKPGRREIWTPNVIGREYQIAREASGAAGAHASPRLHWRRGHFRGQRVGARRAEVRRIWIDPVLVGKEGQ